MLNLGMAISTRNINVDYYYYPTLKKAAEEVKETGIIIKPNDITFNLNDVSGAGLSFTTDYIEIETVLNFYSLVGKQQKKEVAEIKNNKQYRYIEENYIYTITRDSYFKTDNTSVSCEYWESGYKTWDKPEFKEVAERISIIINIIKDYICDYMLQEVRKTDEEISYIMEDIILKVTEKPYYAGEREDGKFEFTARAIDKKGNGYQVTWLADEEKTTCDWKQPYDIKLVVKAK